MGRNAVRAMYWALRKTGENINEARKKVKEHFKL